MAAAAQKIPVRTRLKAWWEGYDAQELHAYERALHAGEDAVKPTPKAEKKPETLIDKAMNERAARDPDAAGDDEALPVDPWDPSRVDIAKYIWGEGFCGPGGPDHIVAMSKLLALSPELSMVDLGAGLGGPARTLATEFGVWMNCYERSQTLVDAGNELSTMAGLAKKVPLSVFNPEAEFELERKFDRALCHEFLFTIEHKLEFLSTVEASLKPEGLMLITDYVLAEESVVASDDYKDWKAKEHRRLHLATQEEMGELIAKAGLALRVNEDRTQEFLALITNAWRGVDKVVAQMMADPEQKKHVNTLLKEAEFWNRRAHMLATGKLKYCRFLAAKRERKKSMMSDW